MTIKHNVITLLQKMIRLNTCQPEGNEADVVDMLLDIFAPYRKQVESRVFEHSSRRKSLLLRLGPNGSGGLAFVGHLDTVAIGDESNWSVGPHEAELKDGRIYGRGAADMKSGVAAMTVAALKHLTGGHSLNKPLYLVYTADEEKGSSGVNAIKASGLLTEVDYYVIPEPTDNKVAIAESGALWLHFEFQGKSAHGSQPQNGINAVEAAIVMAAELKKAFVFDEVHARLGSGSASITQLKGGILTNVIPERAVLEMDIRTLPGCRHEDFLDIAKRQIAVLKQQYPALKVKLEPIKNMPPIETIEDAHLVRLVQEIVAQESLQTELVGMSYYTDAACLIPAYKKPFVILGPGHEAMAHQADEFVAIERLKEALRIYQQIIVKLCS
jgi:succinyl-diaminopimelate desuccinylase